MKKITALILAIILCFTLAIPALGSEMSMVRLIVLMASTCTNIR